NPIFRRHTMLAPVVVPLLRSSGALSSLHSHRVSVFRTLLVLMTAMLTRFAHIATLAPSRSSHHASHRACRCVPYATDAQ
ncbi:MAG TPA: hypothetical protein PLN32_08405, partial [Methanoregulaceae archaeon]|nr:hypothetical protein [Methanoregulaceae archaeon]